MNDSAISDFQAEVWNFFHINSRSMPWRTDTSPYKVLISEIMLQQTQVSRVIPKFEQFISTFPDIQSLAASNLAEVLTVWNGLGYNRRAKFLWQAAGVVMERHAGRIPQTVADLDALPGVGYNTAAAVAAYAYNQPVAFVETNIRTVFLHHFFPEGTDVNDKEILELVQQTLDHDSPREWYWALMDYGTHLKRTKGGRLDQSRHYKKQTSFLGSHREMRGRIIRALSQGSSIGHTQLQELVQADERFELCLGALMTEGLVSRQNDQLYLTGHPINSDNRISK